MKYFALNIKTLRESLNKKQIDLEADLGFKSGVISNYERGKSKPSVDNLYRISNYFKVSIDDLLKTDLSKDFYIPENPSDKYKGYDLSKEVYLFQNLAHLRMTQGMTEEAFARKLGTTINNLKAWENGDELDVDMLLRICSLFRIEVGDILYRDIQNEGYTLTSGSSQEHEVMYDKLIELLEQKIQLYEADMKEYPELAKKWRLD